MDPQFESAAISKIRESKLYWEKVANKAIYRSETQEFVLHLDATGDGSLELYIKRKSTSERCKIYRSQYSSKEDYSTLTHIVEMAEQKNKDAEAYLLKDFVKDKPSEEIVRPKAVYVEDDLMDNTRTE